MRRAVFVLSPFFDWAFNSTRLYWVLSLICAGLLAFTDRHFMNPDGMSYLDIALAAANNQLSELANGYWSPGYPALIGVAIWLFRPAPEQEFPIAHFVTFGAFAFALWSFAFFVRNWRAAISEMNAEGAAETDRHFTPLAYSTFMYLTFTLLPVELVCPDIWVSGLVYLVASLALRAVLPGVGWGNFVSLGLALGAGYYFKEAMFPAGLTVWAMLFFSPRSLCTVSRPRLLLTLSVFLAIATPLFVAVSVKSNRVTFGSAGRLNYGWFVNGLPSIPFGDGTETGALIEHPVPKLSDRPLMLDLSASTGGTYPLWYDPSFWFRDQTPRFGLRAQMKALWIGLKRYMKILVSSAWLPLGAVALILWIPRSSVGPRPIRKFWWLFSWPLVVCAMYALVWVEGRYVGGFLVVWWTALYGLLMLRAGNASGRSSIAWVVICVAVLSCTAGLARVAYGLARALNRPHPPEYQVVGAALRQAGLSAGDRVAVVGPGIDFYGARCARVQIGVQIPFAQEFWRLSTEELRMVWERLHAAGIRVVVAKNRPEYAAPAAWRDIRLSATSSLSILLLPP